MYSGFLHADRERPTRGTSSPWLVFFAAFAVLSLAPSDGFAVTSITEGSGRIFFLKAGAGAWGEVSKGQILATGDQVRTGPGGRATIGFDDGSRIELGPNGSFQLQNTGAQGNSLKLSLGSLRAWVTKSINKRFEIRTPTAVCSVRGTEFGVDVNGQGGTSVQMFNGLLAVSDNGGNEILLKDGQSISVTDKGLGSVLGQGPGNESTSSKAKEAAKREVGLEMSKEQVQAAAAAEAKASIFQSGKAIVDVNGNRVRIEEYIIRPAANQFKLVVLNERVDRFDYFYYRGTFNTALPEDITIALRQLPGCIGAPCAYNLTGYETGRSNTIDNMLEVTSGGHQVDVNNNGSGYDANGAPNDAVLAAYDPATDRFIGLNVPNANLLVGNDKFFKTLYDNYKLTFNGVQHGAWAGANITTMANGKAGAPVFAAGGTNTTVQRDPACAPPNCTFNEAGVIHSVVYAANGDGSVWEKYDNYVISDEGKVAKTSDFAGITSGTQYKQVLLNWNFQTIVTASEFGGRKIDLAVDPKIFIQSGLIP